ncbi:TPA: helix-turn-helix transcriptional regulator [Pseudomonas aeruginosa]|uniref:helix-turn-helix transcriptional regulator n=1 Tax=Pseudomonas aeruginosa TaxID=287 RepID=UPI0009A3A216|nr:AlpA family phage regulatory protein [Pseudomonas aeruginosa]MBG6343465.1 AlpA family phage regulatory protein [Pseudomonas aeruginosa]MBG7169813.1 AlpA family phage regulatory protein [Pseudomonas aeruginosa]MBH8780009.1 AlpA family phage regulatory protein [Pseudomonas aeruginosa]MBI8781496.1 AlpA family phage regulatory protein [Pseudomonas aeruginosa]MBI8899105.1 AlpA family phage regulatory protein [Pseudomonas aeruginosa]
MPTSPLKILRIKDVQARIGLARSTIYDRLDIRSPRYDSSFPKPVKIGRSAIGWLEPSINQWIMERTEESTE